MAASDDKRVFYKEWNQESERGSIVFLHGLYSSHLEFMDVTCCLSEYHLIQVDLPGHARSKDIPFSLDTAVDAVHKIITGKDIVGKAHLVGVSLGGFVALTFAQRYPGVAKSVFSSGATPFQGYYKWFAERPGLLHPLLSVSFMVIPDAVYWWLCRQVGIRRHDDLRADMKQNFSAELVQAGMTACLQMQMDDVRAIERTRIALVAGSKQDDWQTTREMGKVLRVKCEDSRAFVVRNAVHAWDLQFPSLFAEGVSAWLVGGDMPEEYEELT